MSVELKRVRELGSAEDGPSAVKRRALGTSTPPPVENGDAGHKEDWERTMEVKRKEAIYRQMQEYRRSYEREKQRSDELDAQRRRLEASVQAVELCWNQLVEGLSAHFNVDMSERTEAALKPLLDSTAPLDVLKTALHKRMPATHSLLQKFFVSTPQNGVRVASTEEIHTRCTKLQAETNTLRANTRLLTSQVKNLTESREALERDLMRAQKSLDRKRMEYDKAQREWQASREADNDADREKDLKPNGSGHATPHGKMEEEEKPFENVPPPPSLNDTSALERQAESRLRSLEGLRTEHATLQQEHDRLRVLAYHPSEALLRDSAFFQIYLSQLAGQTTRANDLQQRCESTEKKLDELRSNNYEFQQAVITEARAEIDALRQQNTRKDGDLARLRGQRDDLTAEVSERKAKEADKMTFGEQMEVLAKSREDRISFLSSEVLRLKGQLGAQSGSEGYLAFLRGEGGIDGDYVESLESKLSETESKLASVFAKDAESSMSDVRAELAAARSALAKFEKTFGPDGEATGDVAGLARKLEQSEIEANRLRLEVSEARAATDAVYSEVEGLSKLWEGLDKTINSKVFELKDGELKIARLSTEKAKADNKYFAAMRAKEAIDVECKTAQRSVEKQLKLLDRAQEVERGLNAQLAAQDKGLTTLKAQALGLQSQLSAQALEKDQIEKRLQQSQAALTDTQNIMHQRVADFSAERAAKEKLQEEVDAQVATIKHLEEREEALIAASSGKVSKDDLDKVENYDRLEGLLRCSCCKINFKEQVITRCMHTFCHKCLDDRIASRQRKCPACGLAFAKEDVQTIYWQ